MSREGRASNAELSRELGINVKNRRQMAQAADGGGFEDRAKVTTLHRSQRGGSGRHRGIPAPYPVAAGRLSLRASADDPASDAVFFA